jgi:hypothetical protein
MTERLESLGYSSQIIRGKTFLDGLDVADIIGKVPVSYTRRRYGSQTFCWVEAYVGGWFSLGDPWPSVTPRRAEIEAQINTLRESSI